MISILVYKMLISIGITFPSGAIQKKLLEETYAEAGISPCDITYVEAHGTGTPAGDPQECYAIDEVFCKDREGSLLIGSVKSNMGHCESASGMCYNNSFLNSKYSLEHTRP